MVNFQLFIPSALYLIHLFLAYVSFVCGQNVVDVRSLEDEDTSIQKFYYWEWQNRSPSDIVEGSVVESNPRNACGPISRPPHRTNTTLRWFVLIRGCDCDFDLKFKMAQNAGYDLVIAYPCLEYKRATQGDLLSDVLDSNSTIEAIRIKYRDGEKIRKNYLFSAGYFLEILPGGQFNIFNYIIPFVIAVGICMVLLMLFVLVKYIRERRRNQRNRLSSRHLKQLPVIKFKKGDHYDICAICLEEYNEGNKLRVLPCSHAYHTKCIDPWLTNSQRTCPVCKRKIRLGDDSSDSENDSESEESEAPTETTPLLRSLARREALSRIRASNSNFLRNPVINSNRPDAIQDHHRSEGESSQTYCIRPTLEQAAPLQNVVSAEHPITGSESNSAYSSSAPPFLASATMEHEAQDPSWNSSEQTSSLPNVTPSTSHIEVIAENPTKERKMSKDMVV